MQCIVKYGTHMYSQIYKIGSEVYNINFDTCHQDILYFLEQKYEDPWLFFEASRGLRAKKLVNTGIDHQSFPTSESW